MSGGRASEASRAVAACLPGVAPELVRMEGESAEAARLAAARVVAEAIVVGAARVVEEAMAVVVRVVEEARVAAVEAATVRA
jgi:hypothetical protein